jgi:N-methylhydantoinase A
MKKAERDFREESWQGTPYFSRSVDVRYRGQGYELNIPFTPNLLENFEAEHHRRYGYKHANREIELVTLRLRATLKSTKSHVGEDPLVRPSRAKLGRISPVEAQVHFAGKNLKTRIHARESLHPGKKYSGPAIITEYSATTVIPPNAKFHRDHAANLIISQ